MWIQTRNGLLHTTDTTRIPYKTNLRTDLIQQVERLAQAHESNISFCIENGLTEMILSDEFYEIQWQKKRTTRKQILLTMDSELMAMWEELATLHNVKKNIVLEAAIACINPDTLKKDKHRYRIEAARKGEW